MAQTQHLPIYKAAYDLCLYIEQVVQHFSRYHKYSIGTDLRDGARRVLRLVVRANARADKGPVLLRLREELEELKVLLRLCQDTKAFPNFNSFETRARATRGREQARGATSRPTTGLPLPTRTIRTTRGT